MSTTTYIGDYSVEVPASTLADPTSPTRAEWEAVVVAGEARLYTDHVLPRRLVESMGASRTSTSSSTSSAGPIFLETRWMPPSYEEVQEIDRVLARRDRAAKTEV